MSDTNIDERIDKILDYAEIFYNDSKWEKREELQPTYDQLKTQIKQLLVDEYKWLWNATQPDLVPSGTEPDEVGKLILERLAALQGK